jgi:hypothetical protein
MFERGLLLVADLLTIGKRHGESPVLVSYALNWKHRGVVDFAQRFRGKNGSTVRAGRHDMVSVRSVL